MKVLVTGAAGRIGSALVKALRGRGMGVVGLDIRALRRLHDSQDEGFSFRQGDLTSYEYVEEVVSEVQAVVHLAAHMSWLPGQEGPFFDSNIAGTWNLLRACARMGSKLTRVVFASSGQVYPEIYAEQYPIDETHPTKPRSTYGLSKLIGEEMMNYYWRTNQFNGVILRLAHVQDAVELLDPDSPFSGPRFFLRRKLAFLREHGDASPDTYETIRHLEAAAEQVGRSAVDALVLSTDPWGTPFRMQICDTRDIVRGIVLALEHPRAVGETFNIGPMEPFDFGKEIPRMSKLTGLPYVSVPFGGMPYRYASSSLKAYRVLGYQTEYDPERMIAEAAQAYRARGG